MPMIAPMARIPKTSGITFATMVSLAAKPAPKATSDPSSTGREGIQSRVTSASISTT